MKTKTKNFQLLSSIIFLWLPSRLLISCNPIAYDPNIASILPIPLAAPILVGSHFDPFASMQAPQYILAPPVGPVPFDSTRRSQSGLFRLGDKSSNKPPRDQDAIDEKKALDGLPISFIEPEPPSSISERISDSFTALGEGVRNHFRSLTENFSDTMDDLKDAWRPSTNTKKRSFGL